MMSMMALVDMIRPDHLFVNLLMMVKVNTSCLKRCYGPGT